MIAGQRSNPARLHLHLRTSASICGQISAGGRPVVVRVSAVQVRSRSERNRNRPQMTQTDADDGDGKTPSAISALVSIGQSGAPRASRYRATRLGGNALVIDREGHSSADDTDQLLPARGVKPLAISETNIQSVFNLHPYVRSFNNMTRSRRWFQLNRPRIARLDGIEACDKKQCGRRVLPSDSGNWLRKS